MAVSPVKRAFALGVLAGTLALAGAAAAQIDPGVHTAFVADNHLVMDGDGNLHLVYLGWDGAQLDVYHTASFDEGLTWGEPENLSSTPGLSSSEPPSLAVDTSGNVAYVWSEGADDTASIFILYDAVTGPSPWELLDTGNWASGPRVEIDQGGVAHVVWYDERVDGTSLLGYLRYDTRVAFPVIVEHDFIGPETGYVQWPSLAVDAGGGLHVVFGYTAAYGAAPIDIFYMSSADGGLSWSDTTRLSETAAPSMFPHVLADPAGETLHVVWQEGEGTNSEIFYVSNDGKAWTSPRNLSESAGAASRYPTLSTDALGTLHLVWSDEKDGDYDVYHRSYDGWSEWTASENVSKTSTSSLGTTQLEFLDAYGFVAAWVEGNTAPFEIRTSSSFTEVLFTNIAGEAGLDETGLARGAAWGDMDGDGFEDLAVLRWAFPGGRCALFDNSGETFDPAQEFMTGSLANSAAWADYDNNGFRDLAVVQWGGPTLLFHNVDGDSLVEIGAVLGVGGAFEGRALAWCDYDRDGWVDLFVTSSTAGANALYHNDGGLGFSDSAAVAGVDAAGVDCHGCGWADYDQDGWPDLYVAVYGANRLYHNEGNGTFTGAGPTMGVNHSGNSEACSWADIDLDGDLDLFVLNDPGTNVLYRNDGAVFTSVASAAHVDGAGKGTVAIWEDVDNDGDPDLFAGEAATALYRNNGHGQFAEVGAASGVRLSGNFYGGGWADADGDGDADLFLSNGASAGANYLFLNGDHGDAIHHWFELDLVGVESNRDGIGARVTLWSGGRPWTQEENGGLGFSQNSGTLHFGLGDNLAVDSLCVVWPSGRVDCLFGPAADDRMTLTEGSTQIAVWPGDTDNDGDVDEEDLLPLVVYWHYEGAGRSGGFAWTGQPVWVWDPDAAAYADADGDGRVEAADLLPLGVNWGQTHAPVPSRICRPRIEDHGPYLERYRALAQALENSASSPGRDALLAYAGRLIALAEEGGRGLSDDLTVCQPNPARWGTNVRFAIERRGTVEVRVYDVTGRVVRKLVEEELPAGTHEVFWDGQDERGTVAAPGVYLVRMVTESGSRVRKIVVVR